MGMDERISAQYHNFGLRGRSGSLSETIMRVALIIFVLCASFSCYEKHSETQNQFTQEAFFVCDALSSNVSVPLMGLRKCTHIHDAPITILYQRGAQHQTNGQGMCYHKFELGLAKPEVEQYRAEAYERRLVNASHALASEII